MDAPKNVQNRGSLAIKQEQPCNWKTKIRDKHAKLKKQGQACVVGFQNKSSLASPIWILHVIWQRKERILHVHTSIHPYIRSIIYPSNNWHMNRIIHTTFLHPCIHIQHVKERTHVGSGGGGAAWHWGGAMVRGQGGGCIVLRGRRKREGRHEWERAAA